MKDKKIEIPKDIRKQLVEDIEAYFSKERDEDIGDLSAGLLLDFFLECIGPAVYNEALKDVYSFFSEKLEDIFTLEKHSRP
jgi:uncharacterized protein (DUF2164 family)